MGNLSGKLYIGVDDSRFKLQNTVNSQNVSKVVLVLSYALTFFE